MNEPIWQKGIRDAVLLDQLVLIHGNVKDLFAVAPTAIGQLPEQYRNRPFVGFDTWLALELERIGYPIVALYDPVDYLTVLRAEMLPKFAELAASGKTSSTVNETAPNSQSPPQNPRRSLPSASAERGEDTERDAPWMTRWDTTPEPEDFLRIMYEKVLPQPDVPTATIFRFTDRYLNYTDRQQDRDKLLSMLIQKSAMSIPPRSSKAGLQSRIILIFNTEGEVPQELNVQAPYARSVLIPPPTVEEREGFFRFAAEHFYPGDVDDRFVPTNDPEHLRLVANSADGLKMQDLLSLVDLSHREQVGLGPKHFKELLDRFRFGTRENAWLKVKPETLRTAHSQLQRRVKGQDEVIKEVIPVLIRAKLGMSDMSGNKHSSKPRGVFFFVGPTGVGKTELSKAIAELIFGDEKALRRFDMSEYSEEHQQARLVGSPPGYVGFDQGGQLTNAILEKPFSVILFDEIEKAHGRILDKFLQVLDDGRLTDGMGRTVYFSEAIIIFTSNIGTAPPSRGRQSSGNSSLQTQSRENVEEVYQRLGQLDYEELCEHFRNEVKSFFVNTLGRPEILNRIGEENILVFNFLRDEAAKTQIIDQLVLNLDKVLNDKHHVSLFCTKAFRRVLMLHHGGFDRNGARGVRNLLDKMVINPLAEQLFLEPEKCRQKTFRVDYQMATDKITPNNFDKSAMHYEWISNEG